MLPTSFECKNAKVYLKPAISLWDIVIFFALWVYSQIQKWVINFRSQKAALILHYIIIHRTLEFLLFHQVVPVYLVGAVSPQVGDLTGARWRTNIHIVRKSRSLKSTDFTLQNCVYTYLTVTKWIITICSQFLLKKQYYYSTAWQFDIPQARSVVCMAGIRKCTYHNALF